eukprot:8739482-Karenia_brevis.AAC.1
MDDFDVDGMLMEWKDLCESKQNLTGSFAHDPEEAEKYMNNRRLQLAPRFEVLIQLSLPDDVEYHNPDCMGFCP